MLNFFYSLQRGEVVVILERGSVMGEVTEVMTMAMMMIILTTSMMAMKVMREGYLGEGCFLKRLHIC